jgi:hypothetical protein
VTLFFTIGISRTSGVPTRSKSKDYGAALATDDDLSNDEEEDLFSVHTSGLPAKNLNV